MHNLHGKGGWKPPSWCWHGLPGPTGEPGRTVSADKLRGSGFFFFFFFFWAFFFLKKNRGQNKTELQNPKVAGFSTIYKNMNSH